MSRLFTNDKPAAKIGLSNEKGVTIWQEIANIAKDIISGALPLNEVISFIYWRLTGK